MKQIIGIMSGKLVKIIAGGTHYVGYVHGVVDDVIVMYHNDAPVTYIAISHVVSIGEYHS